MQNVARWHSRFRSVLWACILCAYCLHHTPGWNLFKRRIELLAGAVHVARSVRTSTLYIEERLLSALNTIAMVDRYPSLPDGRGGAGRGFVAMFLFFIFLLDFLSDIIWLQHGTAFKRCSTSTWWVQFFHGWSSFWRWTHPISISFLCWCESVNSPDQHLLEESRLAMGFAEAPVILRAPSPRVTLREWRLWRCLHHMHPLTGPPRSTKFGLPGLEPSKITCHFCHCICATQVGQNHSRPLMCPGPWQVSKLWRFLMVLSFGMCFSVFRQVWARRLSQMVLARGAMQKLTSNREVATLQFELGFFKEGARLGFFSFFV